ncbi:MAG TPA: nuclear transport factor 2 family protein [Pyrinomonadaceae bacterium]|nr:nuclear transport factor 2 family protein [Pyrinomonadaceae bacterium]
MKKYLSIFLILFALAVSAPSQRSNAPSDLQSLVEAERAFARTALAKGTREAFIENLADDAVLFRPRPVAGKKWMEDHTSQPGVLTWQPIYAFVSSAGDMGYTTGPWEYREKSIDEKPVAFGYFVTIWKRQADGGWKVIMDLGTRNPQPQTPAPQLMFPRDYPTNRSSKLSTNAEAERAALLKTEDDFSKLLTTKNTLDSYLSYLADNVRLYRTNNFPVVGKESTRAALDGKIGTLTWQTTKADVSRSGDLGYTYGTYELKAGADLKQTGSGNYMRIWRKRLGGKWRIVLDLLNPIPKPAS